MYDSNIGRIFTTAAASLPINLPLPRAEDRPRMNCYARRSVLNMDGHAAVLSDNGSVYILDRSGIARSLVYCCSWQAADLLQYWPLPKA